MVAIGSRPGRLGGAGIGFATGVGRERVGRCKVTPGSRRRLPGAPGTLAARAGRPGAAGRPLSRQRMVGPGLRLHFRLAGLALPPAKPPPVDAILGDITQLKVDAIVTSANESLMGGGGVDKAVHRAAGPGLLQECMKIGVCNPGQAVITDGHWLEVRKIIHTVGPIWEGGDYGEEDVLRSCYQASLALAQEHQLAHLAFPCVATGVYEFPRDRAAEIAVEEVRGWLAAHPFPQRVTFCCFEEEDLAHYRAAFKG